MKPTLLISDLHLDDRRPAITRLFLEFLAGPAREADRLYILGDLFEAWLGDDLPGRTGRQVAAGLKTLADSGVPVSFMHGNRDFLVGDDYCRQAGMTLIHEPVVIGLHGVPTLLMHGDSLCTDDQAYQKFRARSRNPAWQRRILRLPGWIRRLIAARARRASRRHQAGIRPEILDVNAQAVRQAFREHNVKRLIHGHTHRPAIHELDIDGRACHRIVLGDWYEQGSVLRIDTDGIDLQRLDPSSHAA